jgi:hypothetical protein
MDRNEIIAVALSASTREQCDRAEKLIIAWMKEHPRDFGMLDAGEQVAMVSGKYEPLSEEVPAMH